MTHTETGSGSGCAHVATAQQVQKFVSSVPFNMYHHSRDSDREVHSHMHVWKRQEAETEADADFLTTVGRTSVILAVIFVHLHAVKEAWIFSVLIIPCSALDDLSVLMSHLFIDLSAVSDSIVLALTKVNYLLCYMCWTGVKSGLSFINILFTAHFAPLSHPIFLSIHPQCRPHFYSLSSISSFYSISFILLPVFRCLAAMNTASFCGRQR